MSGFALLVAAGCRRSALASAPPPGPSEAPSAAPPVASASASASAAPPSPPAPVREALAPAPAGDAGCPPGMARVGTPPKAAKGPRPVGPPAKPRKPWGTCVDRWEAHLATEEGGSFYLHPHNERPAPGVTYLARSAPGIFPQGYVSRIESQAACKAAGKRLCKRSEWLRACRGLARRTFPYAHHGVKGRCNTGKVHLLAQLHGHDRKRWTYDAFNDPRLGAEPGFLAKGGALEKCVTPEGVFDMNGNLHEWVATDVDEELVETLEAEPWERKKQPWRPGNGIFMGGFFSTTDEHGPGCNYTTIAHEPKYHDYSIGFRCCAEPKDD